MTEAVPAPSPRLARLRAPKLEWRAASVYVAFLLLVLVDLAVTPGFRNPGVLRSLLFESAPVLLIACGQSLAIGTRGIDLSVGSVMGLASAVIGLCIGPGMGVSQGWAMAAGIGAGLGIGLLNGVLIARLRVDPLISGLALLVAARGLAQAIVGGARIDLPEDGVFDTLSSATLLGLPAVSLAALAIAGLVAWLVARTVFGRSIRFVGASRPAAFLAGIPVARTLFAVYGLSGGLAGLAGSIASARLGAADPNYIGAGAELDAIAAAVIGGTPLSGGRISILGTVFGVLLLEVLNATFIMNNINASYAQILKAAFIVGALYLQRSGA